VGYLFGHTYYERGASRKDEKHFVLGDDYKEIWLSSVRNPVLYGSEARSPEVSERSYAVIKEPHGAIGAPLLMEALTVSRIIFLVRDPRDVAVSALHASWIQSRRDPAPNEAQAAHRRATGPSTKDPSRNLPARCNLELPPIGWQLFILGNSQSNSTAFPSFLDTYATRLLAEPLMSNKATTHTEDTRYWSDTKT
jgi:hypothetical protein